MPHPHQRLGASASARRRRGGHPPWTAPTACPLRAWRTRTFCHIPRRRRACGRSGPSPRARHRRPFSPPPARRPSVRCSGDTTEAFGAESPVHHLPPSRSPAVHPPHRRPDAPPRGEIAVAGAKTQPPNPTPPRRERSVTTVAHLFESHSWAPLARSKFPPPIPPESKKIPRPPEPPRPLTGGSHVMPRALVSATAEGGGSVCGGGCEGRGARGIRPFNSSPPPPVNCESSSSSRRRATLAFSLSLSHLFPKARSSRRRRASRGRGGKGGRSGGSGLDWIGSDSILDQPRRAGGKNATTHLLLSFPFSGRSGRNRRLLAAESRLGVGGWADLLPRTGSSDASSWFCAPFAFPFSGFGFPYWKVS